MMGALTAIADLIAYSCTVVVVAVEVEELRAPAEPHQ